MKKDSPRNDTCAGVLAISFALTIGVLLLLSAVDESTSKEYQTSHYTDTVRTETHTLECGPRVGCRELKGESQ